MTTSHPLKVSVQRAHHNHDESDSLGTLDPSDVLAAFDRIDWLDQAAQAQTLQRVAPTFSVEQGPSLIWVSVAGQPPSVEFVASHSFPGEVKRLFGLLKSPGVIENDRQDMTLQEARQAIAAFVQSDKAALIRLFDA